MLKTQGSMHASNAENMSAPPQTVRLNFLLLLGCALSLYLIQYDAFQIAGRAIRCTAPGAACSLGRQKICCGVTDDGGDPNGYLHARGNLVDLNVNILRNILRNFPFQIYLNQSRLLRKG